MAAEAVRRGAAGATGVCRGCGAVVGSSNWRGGMAGSGGSGALRVQLLGSGCRGRCLGVALRALALALLALAGGLPLRALRLRGLEHVDGLVNRSLSAASNHTAKQVHAAASYGGRVADAGRRAHAGSPRAAPAPGLQVEQVQRYRVRRVRARSACPAREEEDGLVIEHTRRVVEGLGRRAAREGLLRPEAALRVQDVQPGEAAAQPGAYSSATKVVPATNDEQLPGAPGEVGRRVPKPSRWSTAPDLQLPPSKGLEVQQVGVAVNPGGALLSRGLDAPEDAEVPVALHGIRCVALTLPWRDPRSWRNSPLALQHVENHDEGRLVHGRPQAAEDVHARADHRCRVAAAGVRRLGVGPAQLPQLEGVHVQDV
mmetsp:Transcript_25710/g.79905  ORF Transcript_25710/g.79905 Transcript_25710/m.79905 type:complete len:371 (+) Transcript_25710:500-1612(+)